MDNDYNAFDQGVSPGGLRSKNQIKLLFEYLVTSLDAPLTSEIAVDALTENMIANYFEAVQALEELIANGSILRNDDNELSITEKGASTIAELIDELPVSIRERALKDAAALQLKRRLEGTTQAKIIETEDGYNTVCKILNKDKILLEITVHTVDLDQADKIRTKFIDDPADIYGKILSILY